MLTEEDLAARIKDYCPGVLYRIDAGILAGLYSTDDEFLLAEARRNASAALAIWQRIVTALPDDPEPPRIVAWLEALLAPREPSQKDLFA